MERIAFAVAIVGLLLISLTSTVKAVPAWKQFEDGCNLYEEGKFELAAEKFKRLLDSGLRCAEVYYNLGNCYYKCGAIGKALVNYRRALMLAPRDEDIRANIDVVRRIVGYRDTLNRFDIATVLDVPLDVFSPRELEVAYLVAYYIACVALAVSLLVGGRAGRLGKYLMVIFGVIALVSYGFHHLAVQRFSDAKEAVVIQDLAEVLSGPGATFDQVATVPEGTEVTLRAQSRMWMEVRLPNGVVGWIRLEDIEKI